MAKFFIPGNTSQRSEEIYAWIIRYVKEMTDCEIEPVRIFSLDYTHEGRQFTATVGQEEPRTRQLVIAILRSDAYLICTPYYGVRRGEPMRIDFSDVGDVRYFELEGLDLARERFSVAVRTLDQPSGSIQSRVHSAAIALSSVPQYDFPPAIVGEFLSVKHKLSWRGDQAETIRQMSDAQGEDAAAAIKSLYVDVLRLASEADMRRLAAQRRASTS